MVWKSHDKDYPVAGISIPRGEEKNLRESFEIIRAMTLSHFYTSAHLNTERVVEQTK